MRPLQHPLPQTSAPLLPIQPSPQSNLLFIPAILHSSKKERNWGEKKKRLRQREWSSSLSCLGPNPSFAFHVKKPMIHVLSIWRRHGVKICLAEERTTRATPLYHILSCAIQPQAHNSRKTAWNSCLPEYCLLNVSCLAGSWNNRWIKGSRKKSEKKKKITLSGDREWELRGKHQK